MYRTKPDTFAVIELDEAIRLANSLNIFTCDAYLIRFTNKYKSPQLSKDQSLVISAKLIMAQVIEVTI